MSGPTGTDARRQAWSTYWARGDLHSCVGSFDDGYGHAIGSFWDEQVSAMAPGSRVLDLATGNGALPLRIWKRHGDAVTVDAVDLASVAPAWHSPAAHGAITFHSGVAMEQLPFATGSHDWIVSQYGLEYADIEAALTEALRVLAPGGRMAFVTHHADSVLVSVGREELANIRHLLGPDGPVAATRGVLPWIAMARQGTAGVDADARAIAARTAYNAAMARLAAAIAASRVPDALVEGRRWLHGLLSSPQAADPRASEGLLDQYRDSLASAALRTSEMLEHALDAARVGALASRLRQGRPGAEVDTRVLRQAEGILGWAITSR